MNKDERHAFIIEKLEIRPKSSGHSFSEIIECYT